MYDRKPLVETVEYSGQTAEDEADRLLALGDILSAAHALRMASQAETNPHHFSHIDLKAFSLPLYEIALYPPTEERVDSANDTYGLTAELLQDRLERYTALRRDPRGKIRQLGRVSELVIFNMPLREGVKKGVAAVPIPASRQDDLLHNIDFFLSPVGTGRIDDGWPFQVKLSRKKVRDDTDTTINDIPLITLQDLDPEHYLDPLHPDSLAQRILRELDGRSTDEDEQALTEATSQFYELLVGSKKIARPKSRQWQLGKLARQFFRATELNEE